MKFRGLIPGALAFILATLPHPSAAFTTGFEVAEYTSAVDPHVHIGRTSGHEEITRQALVKTAEALRKIGINATQGHEHLLGDLAPRVRGTIGSLTPNKIIAGNFCTDAPSNGNSVFSLIDFWELPQAVDWHNDPATQVFHFLRPHSSADDSILSARTACLGARERIEQITMTAAREWSEGRKDIALFLLGHATHVIQDSFSPAHAQRSGAGSGYALTDVCYYGKDLHARLASRGTEASACYHAIVDIEADGIWIRTDDQLGKAAANWPDEPVGRALTNYQYTDGMKRKHLKHEARLARDATVKYLFLVATDLSAHRKEGRPYNREEQLKLAERLRAEFFDGTLPVPGLKDRFSRGAIRCDGLSEK